MRDPRLVGSQMPTILAVTARRRYVCRRTQRCTIRGGSAEGDAVERHVLGFQQAYKPRGVKLELG